MAAESEYQINRVRVVVMTMAKKIEKILPYDEAG